MKRTTKNNSPTTRPAKMGRPPIREMDNIDDLSDEQKEFATLVGEGVSPAEAGLKCGISKHSQKRLLKESPAIRRLVADITESRVNAEYMARIDKILEDYGDASTMITCLDLDLRLELHHFFIRQLQADTLPMGIAATLRENIDLKFGLTAPTKTLTHETTRELTTRDLLAQSPEGMKALEQFDALVEKPSTLKEVVKITKKTRP